MTAEDLRKSILQQAIKGKLVPQDPNDEPASVLLERIREEKARLVKEKKIKKDKNESIIYRGEDNSHYEKFADGTVKCIDEEIPFDIPGSWEWSRLGNIFHHTSGKQQSRNNKKGGIPHEFITTSNLYWGYFNLDNVKIMDFTEVEVKSCSATKGDLLVCEGGAGYGRSAIWNKDYDICLQNHIHRLRPVISGVCEYVYHFIYLLKQSNQLIPVGAAMPGLSANRLKNLLIPIPPLNEQKRIAQRIEEIQPLIDKYRIAQEQAEEMDKSLNELLKKSILQYAIQGKLVPQIETEESASALLEKIQQEKLQLVKEGKLKKKDLNNSVIFKGDDNKYYEKLGGKITEITEEIPYEQPNNWRFVRLENLCWLDDGYKASGEKLPYLDAKYHRGKSEITYLTQGKIVEPPCKAILVDGENSGEIFNITEKGYLGSTFKVLQISKCISEEWLHFLLDTYRDLFKNSKVGAAIPHLNKNLFRNLIVGLPPFEEQQRIVRALDNVNRSL